MTGVLIRKRCGYRHADREKPCEDSCGGPGDASASRGPPAMASTPEKLGQGHEVDSPS